RIGFREGTHVVLVEVSVIHVVQSSHPAPPLPPMLAPCSNCGNPDRLDPWRSPDGQRCAICRRSPASTIPTRSSQREVGQRVTVLVGPFAGYEGTVEARHLVDGRLMVAIAGFEDAKIRVIVMPSEVSASKGSV